MNFEILDTPAIRDILKVKAHLLKIGLEPDSAAVDTLTIIATQYRYRIGTETYLSQMLGELSTTPVNGCEIFWTNGEKVMIRGKQQVQKYLLRFDDELPFRVIGPDGQERYL